MAIQLSIEEVREGERLAEERLVPLNARIFVT